MPAFSGIAYTGNGLPARLAKAVREVQHDDDADERLENEEELALRDQIGLAGLVDQLGDLAHRRVHGKAPQLREDDDPEQEPERADDQPGHE